MGWFCNMICSQWWKGLSQLCLRYELFINLLTWLFCLSFSVPASVQPITNVSEVEGGNVFLYCNASGFPDPTVTWSGHVNKVIMGPWLNITNISRPEDNTNNHLICQCHANNTCGDASRVTSIEVFCKDMFVRFLNKYLSNTRFKTKRQKFNCFLTLEEKQSLVFFFQLAK